MRMSLPGQCIRWQGLNGSWYNTAKPHKFGGFDITLGLNVGMVPSSEKTLIFRMTFSGFKIARKRTCTNYCRTKEWRTWNGLRHWQWYTFKFNTPRNQLEIHSRSDYSGWHWPSKRTELKENNSKDSIKRRWYFLMGVGLMHSISQYFPGDKLLPYDMQYLEVIQDWVQMSDLIRARNRCKSGFTDYSLSSFEDQNLSTIIDAWNVCAIASVNLKVITSMGD